MLKNEIAFKMDWFCPQMKYDILESMEPPQTLILLIIIFHVHGIYEQPLDIFISMF